MTKLPKGIVAADLKYPDYKAVEGVDYENRSFELWHTTGFGWCIPTLRIGNARRSGPQYAARTYATTLDGTVVRIGRGPHVTDTLTVYTTRATLKRLQPFLDLRHKGAMSAGTIRDRISSRRAQGQVERASGKSSWRWDV